MFARGSQSSINLPLVVNCRLTGLQRTKSLFFTGQWYSLDFIELEPFLRAPTERLISAQKGALCNVSTRLTHNQGFRDLFPHEAMVIL